MIKLKSILLEMTPTGENYGLGCVDSNGAVYFKIVSKNFMDTMTHQAAGLPLSKDRFRYNNGDVEWTDKADEETKMIVTNFLTRKGFSVKRHKSYWWDDDDTYPQMIGESYITTKSQLKQIIKEIILMVKGKNE